MKRALIKPETCRNCIACSIQSNYERNAVIRETPQEKPWIDLYLCAGCMKCKLYCPNHAIMEIA